MPNAIKDTAEHVIFGILAVDDAPTAIDVNLPAEGVLKGILIKAPGTNAAPVYVGNAHVTADQAATGGFPLDPGESLTLPVSVISYVYVVATDTSQVINWIIV